MVNMNDLVIDTSVSEADVASVKVGQSATVVFSALTSAANPSGTTVTGKVTAIDPTSTVTSSVVTYGATVTLVKPPAGLRLGQTGTVTVTTAHKTNVLYVSTTAITTTGVGKTVTLSSGGTTRSVRITTGVAGDSTTEVTSGLTAGQTVVLPTTTTAPPPTAGSRASAPARLRRHPVTAAEETHSTRRAATGHRTHAHDQDLRRRRHGGARRARCRSDRRTR